MNAPGAPVNVVFGLLDPGKTVQYVRIGRSYNGSSLLSAVSPHPDSIRWQEKFSVYVEEWDENQKIKEVYHFDPDNGVAKDTGFFPVEGLAVYKCGFKPKRLYTYSMYVHFEDDNRITNGIATIPGKVVVIDPTPVPGRKINLQTGSNFNARWKPAEKAGVYQIFFKVIYKEITETNWQLKEIVFKSAVYPEITPPLQLEKTFSGNRFFSECIIQVDSTLDAVREIVNASFQMYTGGEEFGFYLSSQLNDNNLSSAFGDYTNLSNGIGIFSSISVYTISNLELSNTTLDELAYSDKTRHLGFLDHYGKR